MRAHHRLRYSDRKTVLGRMDSRDHQQRNRLRHRLTDFAAWLHTRESFLHRSVRFQPAFLAEGRQAVRCFTEMVRVRKNRRKLPRDRVAVRGLRGWRDAVNLSLRRVPSRIKRARWHGKSAIAHYLQSSPPVGCGASLAASPCAGLAVVTILLAQFADLDR